jgi:hypothetical protein
MAARVRVYLEVGRRRTFAGAADWPGWCRSGRDEESALRTLIEYGPRYKRALRRRASGFVPPGSVSELRVVERLEGDATTDFGAPSIAPASDKRRLDSEEVRRLAGLLQACWSAFDRVAQGAIGATLRKGPRGGGRELDGIIDHVLGADRAYLSPLGGSVDRSAGADPMTAVRAAFLEAFRIRAKGGPPPRPRRSGSLWLPRYAVRRSAWHALDHAWEIEDRAHPSG